MPADEFPPTERHLGGIDDDELIFRKIPVSQSWYDPEKKFLSIQAFKPNKNRDLSGISMDRARCEKHPEFRSIEEAAIGKSPNGYYVAVLRVGDLRAHGISLESRPLQDNPGHAELPDLRADNRNEDKAIAIKDALVRLVLEVQGPFLSANT